jgi:hypothetical protein
MAEDNKINQIKKVTVDNAKEKNFEYVCVKTSKTGIRTFEIREKK